MTAAPVALLALVFMWAGRRQALPQHQAPAFTAALATAAATVVSLAAITGAGLQMAALDLLALHVALAGLLVGLSRAMLLALCCAALVIALALWGPRPVRGGGLGWDVGARALWHLVTIACAAATAFVIDAVLKSGAAQVHSRDLRYSNLFERSPLAVVIHRHGYVLMANDAALRLLGYAKVSDLVGHLLQTHYETADHERMSRRLARAMSLPPGGTIEPADFKLTRCDGSAVYVTVASSRVELDEGPACESIYLDVSELRHNERALLRSGAMLSRFITASPDIITITVLATGRYLLVNPMFERVSGYSANEVLNMLIAESMLQQWGVEVLQAGDGYEAIDVVNRECGEPGARGLDLVLMDVHMPRLSGDETTVRLRERWDAQALPIVALTAAALVAEQQHALAVGMNDFVTKPIESQRLKGVVLRWVN